MPVFELAEYLDRVARVKARMAREGLDLLVVTDPANMNYLAGYDGWSFYVHQCLILAQNEDAPIWIGRAQDAEGARLTTWLPVDSVRGYPDHYVQSTERHPMDFVADLVADRGWGNGRIGTEQDAYYFNAACQAALESGLPNAGFADATLLVNWERAVKSDAEVAQLRIAGRIMEQVMDAALQATVPGARQSAVAAAALRAMPRGTPEHGGEYPGLLPPLLPTGESSGAPHLTWTDRAYERNEMAVFELGATRHRYHSPMVRSAWLGTPPDRVADLAKVVAEGLEAALDTAGPGVAAEDVSEAWRRVTARHGLEKKSRLGYSIGLGYPPDWGEHTISLRTEDRTELRANMAFHAIASLRRDEVTCKMSEAFLITETGAEALARVPRELFTRYCRKTKR
ncbi:MAG: M24 family metallopeptidase [Proteobacteria bacterium]|nr:M24 family metallopeptidase [Pseudomonadota bacterium]